ncbi:polyprenyl diphosphate synthase [Sinimarinibacterium sp. NLF-5-8]|uniref:polyprenyl diphosphate synthase n=1 Tax=Sinimarinibacterium sp. NLF-5-8 TaxID=2698684 RepID=UPI00137C3B5D|nr:di-trans,poly-cis-decaprenylcistransferase [Sinimarinibacterium sp. NLF-5-8]
MDGNGRWAQQRSRPRTFGHRAGLRAVRKVVRAAANSGVGYLTLFAFSQENWKRPVTEVNLLIQLFVTVLRREISALHKNKVRIRFIGQHADFPTALLQQMQRAEALTRENTGLQLLVAVGYGGQWDIVQAAQRVVDRGQLLSIEGVQAELVTADAPAPDLLIRTGGESRISNFLLWQLAYTELYFCATLWPDFDEAAFAEALAWFAGRQRRFGCLPESA